MFSLAVRDAYSGACAVTGEHSTPALEAAHIKPYGQGGEHLVDNGLPLRSDLHRLYDRGYMTVDVQSTCVVGYRLREEFENGRSWYSLHGTAIQAPSPEGCRPDKRLLVWHKHTLFKE